MIGRMPRLTMIPALALTLAGCGLLSDAPTDPDPDYLAVCTDPKTGTRVEDVQCDAAPADYAGTSGLDDESSFMWFYMPTTGGYSAPPIGQRVGAGAYTSPRVVAGGRAPVVGRSGAVPSVGGPIVRGGFGSAKPGGGS